MERSERPEPPERFDEGDFGLSWLTTMFHADWTRGTATGPEAVRYHLAPDLGPKAVLALRRDAVRLADGLGRADIETLWQAATNPGGVFSDPPRGFTSGTAWMRAVVAECDAWLAVRPGSAPLAGADLEDGSCDSDAVLAEIDRAQDLPEGTRTALAHCATGCTPELAFRLLLRAVCEHGLRTGARLSPERYARLEALGSRMRYGPYLVPEVEFLVTGE
ncbi:hypothetical protein [Streptomyces sp. NPDC046860]|uniref:hypothetical protein n=1 Tax=Streptomyces sp. NPDC046860 TaxID=3154495 RepID=UPI0033F08FAB